MTSLLSSIHECQHERALNSLDQTSTKISSSISSASRNCEVSTYVPMYSTDYQNGLQSTPREHEPPEAMQVDNAYKSVNDHTFTGLHGVKYEEPKETSERDTILPDRNPDREPVWSCFQYDVKEEDEGGCGGNREEARHWVVAPGGVLREVSAEQKSSPKVSETSHVEERGKSIDGVQQSNTCQFGKSNSVVIRVWFADIVIDDVFRVTPQKNRM